MIPSVNYGGKAYLQVAVHESEGVVDSVRHNRHENISRGQEQTVEEHAAQCSVDEVRPRYRMKQLRLFFI